MRTCSVCLPSNDFRLYVCYHCISNCVYKYLLFCTEVADLCSGVLVAFWVVSVTFGNDDNTVTSFLQPT